MWKVAIVILSKMEQNLMEQDSKNVVQLSYYGKSSFVFTLCIEWTIYLFGL